MLVTCTLTFFNEVCGALINEKTNLCSTQLLSNSSYMTCFNSYHKFYLAGFSETILNNVSKYITWSLHPSRIKLGQMTQSQRDLIYVYGGVSLSIGY